MTISPIEIQIRTECASRDALVMPLLTSLKTGTPSSITGEPPLSASGTMVNALPETRFLLTPSLESDF